MNLMTMNPNMQRFNVLVGEWKLSGKTYDSDKDNMSGSCTFSWLEDGRLQQVSEINFEGQSVTAREVISYDEKTGTFPAEVYGEAGGSPSPYKMDIQGNTMMHAGGGGTYTGKISEDGNAITGSWKPDEGVATSQANNYSMVMTRVGPANPG
jgi:hypothetical protein